MRHLANVKKDDVAPKTEKVEEKKPEKSSKINAQIQKMKAKYLKKVKEDEKGAAKQSTAAQQPKKTVEPELSNQNEEIKRQFRSIMDLPTELKEIVDSYLSDLDSNDLSRLADVAEKERSLGMAVYARGWPITR